MNLTDVKNSISGPVFPIVTPFRKNLEIDFDCLKKYVDFLYLGGARIFHVMVHTSRFGLLIPQEMKQINETVALYVKDKYPECIVIAAGPISGPISLNIEFAHSAEESGADTIGLYFSERYYNDKQIMEFFETIASNCNIGILIHEQQLSTIKGSNLMLFPIDLLQKISDIENVIAIKEDSKDDDYTTEIVTTLKEKFAIIVSGGSKEQFLKFAPMGCQAYLVGVGSFFPEIAVRFYQNYMDGNLKNCWDIIEHYERPFFDISKKLGWHIGLKAAMDFMGIMDATERPPLCSLSPDGYEQIANVTESILNIS
jgi:4-hydroxy-tetrahydrodipicolinate synthase